MNLLKILVHTLINGTKFLIGVLGTRKVYNFYKDGVNHFNSLKAEIDDQVRKIVKICSLALTNIFLLFFAIIIFSLGAINFLNDYLNSVYLGHLCVGSFILFVVFLVNALKKP